PDLPENAWRKLNEEAREYGRRHGRAGQNAQVCWAEHQLRDFDDEIQTSLPGAVLTYKDISAEAFTLSVAWKLNASVSILTVTRFKWLGADCGDLVAQVPKKHTQTAQADS